MTQKPAQRTSAPQRGRPRPEKGRERMPHNQKSPAPGPRPPAPQARSADYRGAVAGRWRRGRKRPPPRSGPAPRSPSGSGTRRPAACRRPGAPRRPAGGADTDRSRRSQAFAARCGKKTQRTSFRLFRAARPHTDSATLWFRPPAGRPEGFRRTGCQRGPLGFEPGSLLNIFKGHVVLKMSLVLRNLQRAVPIRRAPLRKKLEIVRSILGVQKFDLAIICVDNKSIQHINKIYREKNLPTDVLSFPFHENVKAGELPQPDFPDDYNLGDIFLGVEYIFQQCKGNEDYYDVLTVTATHGLCHLLGFTHSTEAEWQKMYQKEKQVLEELSRRTGTSLQPLSRGLF
ncbi:endoribonuclease YbeY isoform X2 [Acinonyx jubatus]|nr:endoribonuclease YbeY isoform X2 [Acinonyx jubatus]